MIRSVISALEDRGLITSVIGLMPDTDLRPAFVVWARSDPKPSFKAFVALARIITDTPLTVYVDDVFSQLTTKRSSQEQKEVNKKYSQFFKALGCKVVFSSDVYVTNSQENGFLHVYSLGQKVPYGEFIRCLPENKRQSFEILTLDEVLHSLFELLLLEKAAAACNLLLVGHFSQAIVFSQRKTSEVPLPALVVPRLNGEGEVEEYEQRLLDVH